MAKPDVSVVVLNFNGKEHLRRCLQSLLKQTYKSYEIIVSDNKSSDGSPEMVEKEFPKIRLLRNSANFGVSKGYNVGVAAAKGEYVATVPNDMIFESSWIAEMARMLKQDSRAASTGCYMKNREGGFYKGESCYGFYLDLLGNPLTLHEDTPGYVFGSGPIMFKKSVLGLPYDDEYFYSGDEIYAGWKALLLGYHTAQTNKARLLHIGRVSVSAVSEFAEYHAEKDKYLNLFIFYGSLSLLKLLPLILFNILLTCVLSIFRLRLHIRLRAYWWFLAHAALIRKKRREMQRLRKVSDKEVFRYVSWRVPFNLGPLSSLAGFLMRLYCLAFRLPVMELQKP